MPKKDKKPKINRRLFVAIDLLTMTAEASLVKEEIAKHMAVHRNSVVFNKGRAIIKHYLVFDILLTIKNANMARDNDNFKPKE